MSHLMPRRQFLAGGSRAPGIAGLSLLASAQNTRKNIGASWANLIGDLKDYISKLMGETVIPGVAIAIVKDTQLVCRHAFGFKDNEARKPVDNDTVFEAGSMSKPVFAYAVLKLCERGVLDLDTPLTKYTSERSLESDPRLDLITARHVLSHTSGFQNWRSEKHPLKIHFTPGEKYLYSGEGYSYLQSVVAQVTGQPIEPYMKTNMFRPFGMTSTGYRWNSRLARPHDKNGKPLGKEKQATAESITTESIARYGAAGGLLTTPTDYAKFVIEIINPKPSDAFRLRKDTIAEMLRPHVKTNDEFSSSWALGWQVEQTGVIHHGGLEAITRGFTPMLWHRSNVDPA